MESERLVNIVEEYKKKKNVGGREKLDKTVCRV